MYASSQASILPRTWANAQVLSYLMEKIVRELIAGKVGVLPTDTLYGLVGSALSKKAVERIYKLKKRDSRKPLIILITSLKDLNLFGTRIDTAHKNILNQVWPGKVSVILPLSSQKLHYLHRGGKTLAFRIPAKNSLIELLKKTGPLVAPSANPEGLSPATTVREAKKYFGDEIDFYLSAGRRSSGKPSALIAIENGKIKIYRR